MNLSGLSKRVKIIIVFATGTILAGIVTVMHLQNLLTHTPDSRITNEFIGSLIIPEFLLMLITIMGLLSGVFLLSGLSKFKRSHLHGIAVIMASLSAFVAAISTHGLIFPLVNFVVFYIACISGNVIKRKLFPEFTPFRH